MRHELRPLFDRVVIKELEPDRVVFPASAGAWVEVDEERLLVCRVGELLGVLADVHDAA